VPPPAPTRLRRSLVSPPVASPGASPRTRHASAHVREAAAPPSIRIDFTYHLLASSRREAGEDAARRRVDPLGLAVERHGRDEARLCNADPDHPLGARIDHRDVEPTHIVLVAVD